MESNMERWGEYVFSDLRVNIFQNDRQKRVERGVFEQAVRQQLTQF